MLPGGDVKTVADVNVALTDCATVLMANQSAETRAMVEFPRVKWHY